MGLLVFTASLGLWVYRQQFSSSRQIERLQEEKRVLEQVVQRLGAQRRVADLLVTDQKVIDGVPHTTLLFVEYARDGAALPAKSMQILGNPGHIDAMVINFERHFVQEGDPLRGHSIALFTKIYGDREAPADGHVIDEPGKIPMIYRGADPRISEFEIELWKNFWRLVDDEVYRNEKGVSVASGRGVWTRFERDKLYTIHLEADGGIYIASAPLRGVYREALKRNAPDHASGQ